MDKRTESLIETISEASYKLGAIEKMYFISSDLMKKSQKYFSERKDELALAYREESVSMRNSADILRKSYDEDEHRSSSNAWSILNNCVTNEVYPE